MPSITDIYEQSNNKQLSTRVLVNGADVVHHNPSWEFPGLGIVPTATFEVNNPLPAGVEETSTVRIYAGFNGIMALQFVGLIENVNLGTVSSRVECSGTSRALKLLYKRSVVSLAGVDASVAIESLLQAAGLTNYFIDLPAWTIGTNVPGELEFETYGDAVNEISQVDGSPFYEMPNGETRIELRDPLPGPTPFRQYYSGKLSLLDSVDRAAWLAGTLNVDAIQPDGVGITNTLLRPRLRSVNLGSRFSDVKNEIVALGSVVTTTGADGQETSERLEATVRGPSPYIPNPPQYQQQTVDAALVDDEEKLTEVALRQYGLLNRLQKFGNASVDGDPEMFLGATVQVEDPDYSGVTGRYFVAGYRTSVSENDFVTDLQIAGGAPAATGALITPFACFEWAVTGKVEQILPVGIGPGGRGVVMTFDGGCSRDFDGSIASYTWSDTEGNTFGPSASRYFQAAYDPASVSSVDVTLTVTDNDGLTDAVTKTVQVSGDDSDVGGQETLPTYIFCAAEEFAMGSADGGETWNDISRAAAGVTGKFIKCSAQHWDGGSDEKGVICLFVTDQGELWLTLDVCQTGFQPRTHYQPGTPHKLTPGISALLPFWGPSAAAWLILSQVGIGYQLWYEDSSNGFVKPDQQAKWFVTGTLITGVPSYNVGGSPTAISGPVNGGLTLEPATNWPYLSRLYRSFL